MHNKTAIQSVFDIVENLSAENIIDHSTKVLLLEELTELLEVERQQIIDAHRSAWMNGNLCKLVKGEDYYNQKYNQDGKSL